MTTVPGLLNTLIAGLIGAIAPKTVEPTEIEREVQDGETAPGGLKVIHVPGHCQGQIALLWPEQGGVLFAADAAAHVLGLALSPIYEDIELGKKSLAKLSALDFEVACFGHGKPILKGASQAFRKQWPAA